MNDRHFLAADWPAPESIIAGTTLRTGGRSEAPFDSWNHGIHAGDVDEHVLANRHLLRSRLDLPSEPYWLRQVHGPRVVAALGASDEPEADASWTDQPDTVCVALTADCLPVLFAHRNGIVVAAAHAGWRGLAAGVLENTVAAMPGRPGDLMAWLGPAISQAAFEVGDEVRAAFLATDSSAASAFEKNPAGRWQADLYALARQRLAAIGVDEVYGGDRCTYQEDGHFFSYRRDGQCGRMASIIAIRRA